MAGSNDPSWFGLKNRLNDEICLDSYHEGNGVGYGPIAGKGERVNVAYLTEPSDTNEQKVVVGRN